MRRRKKPGSLEKYLSYEELIIEHGDEAVAVLKDFVEDREVELELGSGCSGFSISLAALSPEKRFLAFEYKEELLLKAVEKTTEEELTNIRFVRGNIEEIETLVAPGSVSKIYLNFSDPWPKKRHEKRRLTSPKFLEIYKRLLKEGGVIEFKTDHEELFAYSLLSFEQSGFRRLDISYDLHAERDHIVMTEYEKKFVAGGKKIMYVKEVVSHAKEDSIATA